MTRKASVADFSAGKPLGKTQLFDYMELIIFAMTTNQCASEQHLNTDHSPPRASHSNNGATSRNAAVDTSTAPADVSPLSVKRRAYM